jgi:hypothetical protein
MPAKTKAQCQPSDSAMADVGAGVEDCSRGGALALGEPERDGLNSGGEITALAKAEHHACEIKSANAHH